MAHPAALQSAPALPAFASKLSRLGSERVPRRAFAGRCLEATSGWDKPSPLQLEIMGASLPQIPVKGLLMFHVRDTAFGPPTEPVRRIDAFSGSPKRRTFTPEEKSRLVAESFASDESVCAFARRHGLMPSQLFAWRKIARSGKSLGSNARAATPARQENDQHAATIEIDLGAAVVRVSEGVDPATLKLVLQVLRDAA